MTKRGRRKKTKSIEGIRFGSEIKEKDFVPISNLTVDEIDPYKTFLAEHELNYDPDKQLEIIKDRGFGRCLNWFSLNFGSKQQKKFVIDYLNNRGRKSDALIMKPLVDWRFNVLGSCCRLRDLGADIRYSQHETEKFDDLLKFAQKNFKKETGKEATEENILNRNKERKSARKKVDVQAATKAMVEKYIEKFEDELYKQVEKDEWKPKVFKKMFNDLNVKNRPMKKIREYFAKLDDDMVSVIDDYLESL